MEKDVLDVFGVHRKQTSLAEGAQPIKKRKFGLVAKAPEGLGAARIPFGQVMAWIGDDDKDVTVERRTRPVSTRAVTDFYTFRSSVGSTLLRVM
jgi:hypothetical protein